MTTIDAIRHLQGAPATEGARAVERPPGAPTVSFGEAIAEAGRERLQLSTHAAKRLEQRRIDLHGERLARLERAMESLARHGGRRSVVMLDQVAYVVHVPSHTVVTAVEPADRKEAVFTQIDSLVIA